MDWDVFISHASEDKEEVARPLAVRLKDAGFRVWLDEAELRLGDSLRQKIDAGLAHSKYGIVILSEVFFNKEWPQKELDALVAREDNGLKIILPVWHGVDKTIIARFSPLLADRLGVSTKEGLDHVAAEVAKALTSSEPAQPKDGRIYDGRPLAKRRVLGKGRFAALGVSLVVLLALGVGFLLWINSQNRSARQKSFATLPKRHGDGAGILARHQP